MTHDKKPADVADSLSFECDLEEPPEQVWRALTEPELLAAWLEPDAMRPADDGRGSGSISTGRATASRLSRSTRSRTGCCAGCALERRMFAATDRPHLKSHRRTVS